MEYLIGIDIGTSGTKTVIFNRLGETIASHTVEYELFQPEIGWAEQRPEDWWNAVCKTIKASIEKAKISPEDIKGIGLSGQMHGLVLLDRNNNVIRPALLWCDLRTAKECDEIMDGVGRSRILDITGNPVLPAFTAPKIQWVKNHEKENFNKINKVLLPKDYIKFMLTGEYCSEYSDASGTSMLDIKKREWSLEILDFLGLRINQLPSLKESCEVMGYVNKRSSELTGLKEGTPVVGGAGDQAAGAIGNGIVKKGMISATVGTSGVVFAYTDKVTIDREGRVQTFCHAIPNTWHVMGVTNGAGLSFRWLRDNLCDIEKSMSLKMGRDPYEFMTAEAEKVPAGCMGLIYLPYIMGERTPHLNTKAKGVLFGLSAIHTKNHIIRAFMEGVSYSLKDCLSVINSMGIDAANIRLSGGGARSELWKQILSDIFASRVSTVNSKEGPALGVAILAAVGTGIYKSIQEACDACIKEVSVKMPIMENVNIYKDFYGVYKNLYVSLKEQYDITDAIIRKYGK
ncbi:MAG: xylulokinase [Clostridiales bacterium]|nr:xylulokinase [Clostridiales bacterium]